MMNLRPYQSAAIAEIRQAYQQRHRSVLFVLPTGGGKTVVFSHIAIGRRRGMKSPAGWARHVMAARSLRSGKARVREVVA